MQAVIFDMDGTLLASEHLWKQAEKTVFSALGVDVEPALVPLTEQMSAPQVINFWYERQPWQGRSFAQVDQDEVDEMAALVRQHGQALPGVTELLESLKQHNIQIALATNAPARLIPTVFETLAINAYFAATVSADEVLNSKPAPDIYHKALQKLNVAAKQAIAVEDTITGLTAAQQAGIKTIAVPESAKNNDVRFDIADLKVASLATVDYQILKLLCANE